MIRIILALLTLIGLAQAASAKTLIDQTMDHIDPAVWQRAAGDGKPIIGNSLPCNILCSGEAIIYNPQWKIIDDPVQFMPGKGLKLFNTRVTPDISNKISTFYGGQGRLLDHLTRAKWMGATIMSRAKFHVPFSVQVKARFGEDPANYQLIWAWGKPVCEVDIAEVSNLQHNKAGPYIHYVRNNFHWTEPPSKATLNDQYAYYLPYGSTDVYGVSIDADMNATFTRNGIVTRKAILPAACAKTDFNLIIDTTMRGSNETTKDSGLQVYSVKLEQQ